MRYCGSLIGAGVRVIALAALAAAAGCYSSGDVDTAHYGSGPQGDERYSGYSRRDYPEVKPIAAQRPRGTTDSASAAESPRQTMTADRPPARRTETPAPRPAGAQGPLASLAYPTGEKSSSVLLVEKYGPDEVRVNQPYAYEIRVTNLTDRPLAGVVIREKLPDTFKVTTSDPAASTTAPSGEVAAASDGSRAASRQDGLEGAHRYVIGELGPRESRSIKVNGVPSEVGALNSCVVVSYNPTLCSTAQVINPILRIMGSGPSSVDVCDQLKYRYQVANVGVGTARSVHVEQVLPDGLETLDGKHALAADIGDLPAGQSRELVAPVRPTHAGQFSTKAVARDSFGTTAETDSLSTIVRAPKLAVDVRGPDEEYINKATTYRVAVTNTGDGTAKNVALKVDTADAGQFLAAAVDDAPPAEEARPGEARLASGRGPSTDADLRDLGSLEPGQTRHLNLTIRPTKEGTMKVGITATDPCAGSAPASLETRVLTIAALRLEVVDQDDPVRVGNAVNYLITVKNQGTGADRDVRIVATLPDELEYVSATGPAGAEQPRVEGKKITFPPVPTLPAGEKVTWQLQAKALRPDDVRFQVELTSQSLTKPAMETEPTRLY